MSYYCSHYFHIIPKTAIWVISTFVNTNKLNVNSSSTALIIFPQKEWIHVSNLKFWYFLNSWCLHSSEIMADFSVGTLLRCLVLPHKSHATGELAFLVAWIWQPTWWNKRVLMSFEKWKELSSNFKTLPSKLDKEKVVSEETGSCIPTSFYKFLSNLHRENSCTSC